MSKHFIVIGNPIAHSQSPQIHQLFAEQTGHKIRYQRQYCPNNTDSFVAVVEAFFNGGGDGANVTVPFKQMAYDYCHEVGGLTPHARVAGAVNTLFKQADILFGGNTDGMGFVNHVQQLGWSLEHANVAIIGAGGAARGIVLPLLQAGVRHIHIANRTPSRAQRLMVDCLEQGKQLEDQLASLFVADKLSCGSLAQLSGHYDLIINATAIGLSDEQLPLSDALSCDMAYDMMYGKSLPFLQHFSQLGALTSDGLGMLVGQAALSYKRWTDAEVDTDSVMQRLMTPPNNL